MEAKSLDTGRELSHQVFLGPHVHTVPVPVVGTGEVAPALMMLGGQNNICTETTDIDEYTTLITTTKPSKYTKLHYLCKLQNF